MGKVYLLGICCRPTKRLCFKANDVFLLQTSIFFLSTLLAHNNFLPFLVIIGREQQNKGESSFPHSHGGVGPVEQRGSCESRAVPCEQHSEWAETTRCEKVAGFRSNSDAFTSIAWLKAMIDFSLSGLLEQSRALCLVWVSSWQLCCFRVTGTCFWSSGNVTKLPHFHI